MMILVIFAPFVYNITLSKTGKDYDTTGSRNVIKLYKFKTP